jgi:hypothetical protein
VADKPSEQAEIWKGGSTYLSEIAIVNFFLIFGIIHVNTNM